MKTIKNLAVPQDASAQFPFSTIKNETDTENGTPVVREIYGDVLTNLYKLLQVVGIVPTNTEDSDITQYQILEALKKLPNSLNDIEQVLSLSGLIWSVPLDTAYLPNKYFFVARASDNYVSGTTYTFEGSNAVSMPFSSTGFNASDEILVIIDTSGVRAYSLSFLSAVSSEVFTVLGTPIAFNDTNKVYYQEDGVLMSDVPSVDYLESVIRVELSDGTILVNDILILNGYVLCFCLIPSTNIYFFRHFELNDLSASQTVSLVGTSFASVSDFFPYVYAESGFIYITNAMNANANDYSLTKLSYNPATAQLTLVSTFNLEITFAKTSNAVIKGSFIYTYIAGVLNQFNLSTGVKVTLGNYAGVIGNLFGFNNEVYFSSGEVAKKWTL